MENLDLDINNYSIKDIEQFFRLKPNTKYTASDIELKECQIRETLLNSGHINKRFKTNLIDFLTLAKRWLTFVKCPHEKPPTTVPKNWKLDPLDTPVSKESMSRLEELVQRPETQYIYTNNSDFFPGKINPLNTRLITKCLNIDTRFRENLYNTQCSDFTIQLPTKFNKVVSMQLSAIELPISFYGISASYGNNYICIKVNYDVYDVSGCNSTEIFDNCDIRYESSENSCDDSSHDSSHEHEELKNVNCELVECDIVCRNVEYEKTFIIPDGNYTASDLIDTINFIISPVKHDHSLKNPEDIFSYIQFSIDITASGSGSRKVSIGPNPNHKLCEDDGRINNITLDFTKNIVGIHDIVNLSTKLGWNLGFTRPKYTGDTFYTADTIIEPTTKYIYLAVDDFNNSANNHFVSAFNQSILNTDILARISIKGSFNSIITENDYNLVTEPRHYFGPVDINRLRIRLFDEFGRILSMNNSNYSLCLTLKILYDL